MERKVEKMLRPRHGHRLVALVAGLFGVAVALNAPNAAAEDASATETAAARSLAVDGLKLAQAGNCAEATSKLERAEKLYHSAVVASRLGECYVDLGRLVEGTEILRKVLREPVPAEPQPALLKALERAQRALDSAKPRIASLIIKVAAVQEISLKVDGKLVPISLLDTEIPTDPGEHAVEASAPGFLKSHTRINLGAADKKTVTLTLTRDPNAPTLPTASAATALPRDADGAERAAPKDRTASETEMSSRPSEPRRTPNRTAAYVTLGLGAVGIGVGSAFGVMAISQRKELKQACPADVCPAASQESLDFARRLGTVATVAFGVGAAGLALGTVLLFTGGSGSPERGDHALKRRSKFAGLSNPRAALGIGSVRFDADF